MNLRDVGSRAATKLAGIFRRHRAESLDVRPGPMSQEDRLVVVKARVEDAQYAADVERSDWRTWREFFSGEGQAAGKVAPGIDPELLPDWTISNFTQSTIETATARLTQASPSWYVVAEDQEQDEGARKATDYLQAYAKAKHLVGQLQMVYRDVFVVGTGAIKTYWDSGQEEVVCRAIDPEMVYPDPTATALERCEYLALRNIYGAGLAERLWPELDLENERKKPATVQETNRDEIDQQVGTGTRVEVVEFYYEFGKKLMVYSGEQVLFDGDNPMPNERYPVFLFQRSREVKKFWPPGLVADLMDLQNGYNRGLTRIAIYHRYMTNPNYHCDDKAAQENVNVNPGGVTFTGPEGHFTALRPPPLPGDVFQVLNEFKSNMDNISGVQDVLRGIRPKGITAGVAIEGLHQLAEVRMTGTAADWNYVLADVGQGVLDLMAKHYSEERRVLPVLDEAEPKRVEIGADDLSVMRETDEFEETGELDDMTNEPMMQPKMEPVPHKYRVVTQPGGDLPLSQAALAELSIQLAQLEIVDAVAVLDAVKYPGRDKLIERMAAQAQAQVQGEAAAGQEEQMAAAAEAMQERLTEIQESLSQTLTPEEMELVEQISEGSLPPEAVAQFSERLTDGERRLVAEYIELRESLRQVAQGGAEGAEGQPQGEMALV